MDQLKQYKLQSGHTTRRLLSVRTKGDNFMTFNCFPSLFLKSFKYGSSSYKKEFKNSLRKEGKQIFHALDMSYFSVNEQWWPTENTRSTFITAVQVTAIRIWEMFTSTPPVHRSRHYENTPIQIYRKFHLQKLKNFKQKTLIFFIFLLKT